MPFGLYLHLPFRKAVCTGGEFNNEIQTDDPERQFYHALEIETRLVVEKIEHPKAITSIYVGGGTPSLINIKSFNDWLSQLRSLFTIDGDAEFTVECSPESVDLELLDALKDSGVNRLVFDCQTFNPKLLKILGRNYGSHHSQQAVYYADLAGFENIGIDLLFGIPSQTGSMLSNDFDLLLSMEPQHVSLCQFSIEQETDSESKVEKRALRLPDDDYVAALYQSACEFFKEAGYYRYELLSFARDGCECRHNLGYWQGDDYLGLGPSAHSFLNGQRFINRISLTDRHDLIEYMECLEKGELPRTVDNSGSKERITETILMGLRLADGIDRARFEQRFGVSLESRLNNDQYHLLVQSGHLIADRDSVRLASDRMFLADEIAGRLLK